MNTIQTASAATLAITGGNVHCNGRTGSNAGSITVGNG